MVAAAKKCDNAKQLVIVPALLRGKLVDFFVELSEEDRANMQTLKRALSAKAGLVRDHLPSAKCFNMRKQGQKRKLPILPETSRSCSARLTLVACWGLSVQQLLLKGRPANLEQEIKEATEVEYALHLSRETAEVHAVQQSTSALIH